GEVEGVERAPLVENRRLRGIEIFGLTVAECPAAERDHPPGPVGDREDDAPAEKIDPVAAFGFAEETRLHQQRLGELAAECGFDEGTRVRRPAQAESPDEVV